MFTNYDEVPTLLRCGYRSKVCTSRRATKIDGTLHKLCEFHRRKANLNQQRLHQRQREQRAKRQESTAEGNLFATDCPNAAEFPTELSTIDPIPYATVNSASVEKHYPRVYFSEETGLPSLSSTDMSMLQLLLEPQGELLPHSALSVDEGSSVIV